ncbi:MAG TPA: M23 family metallopeptidase [Chitinivibrionales bacterium]|nr:M23 family metallopeptidase [Chitinivibrionales bacterium]
MRKKERKEILLVPPGGSKVRPVHVPRRLVAFCFIVIAAGFAGYFIPFNSFSIDVVQRNQQKNLENQNKKLWAIIKPVRRMLDNLGDELQGLEKRRQAITGKMGTKDDAVAPARQKRREQASLGDLEARAARDENFFQGLAAMVSSRPGSFDSVPLIMPVEGKPVISARFEKELDPFTGTMKNHTGTDFIGVVGTPVIATASGTVSRVEDGKIWGKRILINHGFGYGTVYAHLGTVQAFAGKKVKKGDCIALMGLSGFTSGPHVHYEIWYRGKPVNPEDMFYPDSDALAPVALR